MPNWWPSANAVPPREGFKKGGNFSLDPYRRRANACYIFKWVYCAALYYSRCWLRDNSWIYIYYLNPGWVSSATLYWRKNTVLGQSSTSIPLEQWPHYSAANNPTVKREKVNWRNSFEWCLVTWWLVLEKVPSEGSQARRRPLLGPSPGWKRLLPLSHLRHY